MAAVQLYQIARDAKFSMTTKRNGELSFAVPTREVGQERNSSGTIPAQDLIQFEAD
jgi:hypothetical protein